MNLIKNLSLIGLSLMLLAACDKDDDKENLNDDVFELAVRRINPGQNINEFTSARDAFVAELISQEGTSNDREVQPFFDFSQSLPLDSVYIGMTQYKDLATYQSIGQTLGTSQVAGDFFSTFAPLVFETLQPLEEYKPVSLGDLAPLGSGQVLEIAVRDLSAYPNFNQTDYENKRDAFLSALQEQNGFVREVQWQSVNNSDIVAGMTVYASQQAAIGILSDASFTNSEAVTNFLGTYPPNRVATINTVLK
jgi:hypothetical protein